MDPHLTELLAVTALGIVAPLLARWSGTALGVTLAPFLLLVFPVDVALAVCALIQGLGNLLLGLRYGIRARAGIVGWMWFGALPTSILGAVLVAAASEAEPLAAWVLPGKVLVLTADKLLVGVFLLTAILAERNSLKPYAEKASLRAGVDGWLLGLLRGIAGQGDGFLRKRLVQNHLADPALRSTLSIVMLPLDLVRLA